MTPINLIELETSTLKPHNFHDGLGGMGVLDLKIILKCVLLRLSFIIQIEHHE